MIVIFKIIEQLILIFPYLIIIMSSSLPIYRFFITLDVNVACPGIVGISVTSDIGYFLCSHERIRVGNSILDQSEFNNESYLNPKRE